MRAMVCTRVAGFMTQLALTDLRLVVTINEPLAFLCPIAFIGLDRLPGIQSFQGERFEFLFHGLVVECDPLDVRLNRNPCRFSLDSGLVPSCKS
jgi:hypothetical protein